jgi:hypothetical protein
MRRECRSLSRGKEFWTDKEDEFWVTEFGEKNSVEKNSGLAS